MEPINISHKISTGVINSVLIQLIVSETNQDIFLYMIQVHIYTYGTQFYTLEPKFRLIQVTWTIMDHYGPQPVYAPEGQFSLLSLSQMTLPHSLIIDTSWRTIIITTASCMTPLSYSLLIFLLYLLLFVRTFPLSILV